MISNPESVVYSAQLRPSNDCAIDGQFCSHKSCFVSKLPQPLFSAAKLRDSAAIFSRRACLALSVLQLPGSEHFQYVMRQTHQQPFRFHSGLAPQQKLTKATHMFQVSKDRFDDRLPLLVNRRSFFALQLMPHSLLHSGLLRGSVAYAPACGSRALGGT